MDSRAFVSKRASRIAVLEGESLSTAAAVSAVEKLTTGARLEPSMVVTLGPWALWTAMSLPLKSMFSKYVPGATNTVSPLTDALMAAWMVG